MKKLFTLIAALFLFALLIGCGSESPDPPAGKYFAIEVIDQRTGRGVPAAA
jgi:predicted small lipoprotein YifL